MTRWITSVGAVALLVGFGHAAAAQADERLPGRVEFSAGPLWIGHAALGSREATLTAADGSRYRLFTTSTDLASASGVEARFGLAFARMLQVEASASYARPPLRTVVSGDVERGASVTASEGVQQLIIDGALVIHLTRVRIGSRGVPFAEAGTGYLRQLHDGGTLVETGRTYHVGGGVKYLFVARSTARFKSIGVRADARAVVRAQGVALDGGSHASPAFAASLFVRF